MGCGEVGTEWAGVVSQYFQLYEGVCNIVRVRDHRATRFPLGWPSPGVLVWEDTVPLRQKTSCQFLPQNPSLSAIPAEPRNATCSGTARDREFLLTNALSPQSSFCLA